MLMCALMVTCFPSSPKAASCLLTTVGTSALTWSPSSANLPQAAPGLGGHSVLPFLKAAFTQAEVTLAPN